MSSEKRAKSVLEAAYNHLLVFTEPVGAWPAELAQKLPSFAELYVEPPSRGRRRGPAADMDLLFRQTSGPVKLLLTGQKGSGKSWTLHHLGDELADQFAVVRVSATDHSGTTLADAEVSDVMVLLCDALAQRMGKDWHAHDAAEAAVSRWVDQLSRLRSVPTVPDNTEAFGVDLSLGFAKFTSRMRADVETRRLVRQVGADDLIIVANAMLAALAEGGKPPLVLFDDLDKINPVCARKLYGEQFNALARVSAKMVLTFPYSLNFANVLTQRKEVLENVQVKKDRHATTVLPAALERFTAVLGRLVELELVEATGVEEAVRYSGGITREFGRILARAFEIAALCGDERVMPEHVADAIRELRIELERATNDAARRKSLGSVRATLKLESELDWALLNENMVVEYVNGHPWYDVHPLLGEVVDSWPKPTV